MREAGAAQEALLLFGQGNFDAVVSDIGMPGEDGFAFIKKLRAMEQAGKLDRTPVIALTAYARADDRRRILIAGFQAHVSKPVEPSESVAV